MKTDVLLPVLLLLRRLQPSLALKEDLLLLQRQPSVSSPVAVRWPLPYRSSGTVSAPLHPYILVIVVILKVFQLDTTNNEGEYLPAGEGGGFGLT